MAMGTPSCQSCGHATEPDARFCGVCGAKLEAHPPALDATIPDLRRLTPTTQLTTPAASPVRSPSSSPQPIARAAAPAALSVAAPTALATSARSAPRPRPPSPPTGHAAPAAAPARAGGRLRDSKPPMPSLDRLIGRTLNSRYLVERRIGEGGFGAVFRGRQVATGREVALKILHPHNVGDATVVARFRREAEACSKLTNPHTVVIYDFDETEDGTLYLAMELLRGRPLQDVERTEGPLDARRVLTIVGQVAEALGEAHEKGVIHRDMKPENVMIETREGDDFVKVLDFGIAKLGEANGREVPALTAVGQTLGTLEFMSPEQLRGRPLDGRSDLYALGIMAYEMLTGMLPWREARIPLDVIKFHLETEAPTASSLRRDLAIPREVDELLAKMVAKDPADRHGDAGELRQDIDVTLATLDRKLRRSRALRFLALAAGVVVILAAATVAIFR